ncbi:MAG TPA: inner membrane protein YhjD [Pseudonocardiaceae bacterium]
MHATKAPGEPEQQQPSFLQRQRDRRPWFDHLVRAGARYTANNGDHYAAAITYFSVLALIPLLMIGFSLLGFVLFRQPELIERVKSGITEAAPPNLADALTPLVDTAVERRTAVGLLGLLGAVYSGLGWIGNLREALTAQWNQLHDRRSFLATKGVDALALLGLGLALVISLGITAAGTAFTNDILEFLGVEQLWWAKALVVAATVTLALIGNWLVFLWVIARLPREPVTLRSAAKAAVLGAVGFEILKQVVTLFLSSLSGPAGAVFGPVIGLLVFAFLVSRFLLFVTAWAATARENEQRVVPPPPGAVIRPTVTLHRGPDGRTAGSLLGAGALLGLGLSWLLRRR